MADGNKVYYCGPIVGMDGKRLDLNVINQNFQYLELDPSAPIRVKNSTVGTEGSHDSIEEESAKFSRFVDNLYDGRIYDDFFSSHKPDVFIVDIFFSTLVIVLQSYKSIILLANTFILGQRDINIPPINLDIIPSNDPNSVEQIDKIWNFTVTSKQKSLKSYIDFMREISIIYNFDFEKYFHLERSIVPFGFELPELIFWDIQFDFPRTERSLRNKFFLGNIVDVDRLEGDLESYRDINPGEVVYVSLGTKKELFVEKKQSLMLRILQTAALMPDYTFIISAAKKFVNKYSTKCPSNVLLKPYCPQMHILSKSAVMITHAGGSIKECIRYAVPTLCYPFDGDQYGNTARIVYHGLGLKGDIVKDDAKDIKEMLSSLIQSKSIKNKLKQFQKETIQSEVSKKALTIFQSLTHR